jgi:hypothetical protein
MPENKPDSKPDKVTETIDYIFKMRQDGRMDEEEASLALDAIFSGELSEKELEIFRFMYLFRKKDGSMDMSSHSDSNTHEPDGPGVTIMIQIK